MQFPKAIVLALSIATMAGCGGGGGSGAEGPPNPPPVTPPVTRAFDLGFTTWPYDATVTAVNFVYTEISARGDFIAHHMDAGVPWQAALDGAAYDPAVEAEIQARLDNTPANQRSYLAISPFSTGRDGLAGNWGATANEPLVPPWDTRDFDSPEVIAAYTNFARDMITRFQPTYFNLGIEASELLVNDLPRFNRYVTFASQVATALRADFPDLQFMISVALKSPGSVRAETIEANIGPLIDLVDVVGISVYPYVFFDHADKGDPQNLPSNWLSQVQTIANGKPIAIAETAWIAERLEVPAFGVDVAATAQNQADYIVELFAEAEALDAEFIVWWALVDFDALWNGALGQDPLARIWRDTGLFDESLNPRPALDIWQQQLMLPR
ncbi:MAG: hypothetical protein QNI96_15600 [Woeseiaceae bacterium]|nr:hypothetical protein [Woeseiaceae bacterium]